MIQPGFQNFVQLSRKGNWVPVWTSVPADLLTPVSAYLKLTRREGPKRRAEPFSFLLESVEGGETVARYTYLGADPVCVLRYWMDQRADSSARCSGKLEISEHGRTRKIRGDLTTTAREVFDSYRPARTPELPPFTAGAVGYLAYDLIAQREPVQLAAHRTHRATEGTMPDAVLMFPASLLVFDHVKHQIIIVRNVRCQAGAAREKLQRAYREAESDIRKIERALEGPLESLESRRPSRSRSRAPVFRSNVSKAQFLQQVRRAKRHIVAGDIFQVVLSQKFEAKIHADPFDVYRALRRVNPAPYLFFLRLGEDSVLGSSPEMLVKVTGDDVEYRPIAGTRPRGKDPAEDQRLERDLLADEKERAEHVMLVDLGRNDLGRVCDYGSVKVKDLMFVERYSHVMHLVSSITGTLRRGLQPWDALWACFPAGTVTGAPKVRAMQLISEIEPERRGLYAGSVLYFDLTGNLNSCIAIRSVVIREGKATVQVGAGIVADSVPEREFDETMNKGRAMLKAIEMAEGQDGDTGRR